jgi:hypothetical protein
VRYGKVKSETEAQRKKEGQLWTRFREQIMYNREEKWKLLFEKHS